MYSFRLPDIGEGVVEAEVVAWRVAVGDVVELDQILVELMTDKANVEIPSPAAGKVTSLPYAEGDIVPVGEVLIEIDDGGVASASERKPASTPAAAPKSEPERDAAPISERGAAPVPVAPESSAAARGPSAPPSMPSRPVGNQRATAGHAAGGARAVPAVRALAERLGIDLASISGSGPGGRTMRRDVEAAASRPAKTNEPTKGSEAIGSTGKKRAAPANERVDPSDWQRQPLRGIRRAIARHMQEARRRAAHFTYVEELDITDLMAQRAQLSPDLSPLAFIAGAVLRALPSYPELNASIDDDRDEIILKSRIHLGIAAAANGGLVVPVISNAQLLDTRSLSEQITGLAERARDGTLVPAQLRGGTFTISSLGKLGGIVSTPIVNHPEVAILGVNAIRRLPRYIGDTLQPRDMMNLSISVDHRITDGQEAALFVRDLARILEKADFPDVFGHGAGTEEKT
ncbi:MAG: 2-oxo acid dehydrogenase subunit E2 [bacterium]|nr:2-oxo acid dehydrogenase subunit E2 [bacterium]